MVRYLVLWLVFSIPAALIFGMLASGHRRCDCTPPVAVKHDPTALV